MADAVDLCNTCLYIAEHLDGDLSLEALAQRAGLSRFRFHRVFKAWSGETLHDYVTRLRMESAALALSYPVPRSSRRSVKAIAMASGYRSLSSFSHAFSSYMGASPREYRYGMVQRRARRLRARTTPSMVSTPVERKTVFGRLHHSVREERELDLVMVATNLHGYPEPASWERAAETYGVERFAHLFARASRIKKPLPEAPAQRVLAMEAPLWQDAARGHREQPKRSKLGVTGGRYLVIEGETSVAALYRIVRRNLDAWLSDMREAPRAESTFVRFSGAAPDGVHQTVAMKLYIPLEPVSERLAPRRTPAPTAIPCAAPAALPPAA